MEKMQFLSSERGLSQSLTNLPKVTVTDLAGHSHLKDEFQETKSRSQPCSPRPSRRAFTTCIAGTRYIIGELFFLKLSQNSPTWLKNCWLGCKASAQSLQRLLIIMSSYSVAHSTCLPKGWRDILLYAPTLKKTLRNLKVGSCVRPSVRLSEQNLYWQSMCRTDSGNHCEVLIYIDTDLYWQSLWRTDLYWYWFILTIIVKD